MKWSREAALVPWKGEGVPKAKEGVGPCRAQKSVPRPRGRCGHPSGSLAVGRNLGTLRLLLGAAYLCSGAVVIGCLGPMVGTVVVAVNPPGPSAQMAIAEAAGPCPKSTAFCRERGPPMPTSGDNGPTLKKKEREVFGGFMQRGAGQSRAPQARHS